VTLTPDKTRQVLADNIRAYRLIRRLKQEDVAAAMRLEGHPQWRRVTVGEIERQHRTVTAPELVTLTIVLGASLEQLLNPTGPA
jgi:transcriptional regulator with XRE-family HTH domain